MLNRLNLENSGIILNTRLIGYSIHAFDEEIEITKDMVLSRKVEFLTGRACARVCLNFLGFNNHPLLINTKTRAPIWPKQCVGSISHSKNECVAVVALKKRYRGLGVDIEEPNSITDALLPFIATKNEINNFTHYQWDWPTTLFSIKESIYKCAHQAVGINLEFLDVEVELLQKNEFKCCIKYLDNEYINVYGKYLIDTCIFSIAYIYDE